MNNQDRADGKPHGMWRIPLLILAIPFGVVACLNIPLLIGKNLGHGWGLMLAIIVFGGVLYVRIKLPMAPFTRLVWLLFLAATFMHVVSETTRIHH